MKGSLAIGVAVVLAGCDLGIDEAQITGAGGAPSTSVAAGTTGPGATTSGQGSSVSTGSGDGGGPATTSTTTTTTTSTSTAASTSTGVALPQVACINNMFNVIQCAPGQVCCVSPGGGFGHCADQCPANENTFECDGPEDCQNGEDCCAPQEENGDVSCVTNCSDDDTVCKGDGDCVDDCSEEFIGPLGKAYVTCF